jgi:hypothetical protein
LTPQNHEKWIEKAKRLPQRELEKQVAEENPKSRIPEKIRPVAKSLSELKVAIDEETEKNLDALKDILSQKLRRAASLKDVIAWAAQVTREKFDPEKKAERSAKRISSRKPPRPQSGRHPIPASVKHEVVQRQGRRCTFIGPEGRRCEQRRWLHFHHLIPVARGGLNTPSNLELRGSAHHALAHQASPSSA